jgi:hypothetical protein
MLYIVVKASTVQYVSKPPILSCFLVHWRYVHPWINHATFPPAQSIYPTNCLRRQFTPMTFIHLYDQSRNFLSPPVPGGHFVTCVMMSTLFYLHCDITSDILLIKMWMFCHMSPGYPGGDWALYNAVLYGTFCHHTCHLGILKAFAFVGMGWKKCQSDACTIIQRTVHCTAPRVLYGNGLSDRCLNTRTSLFWGGGDSDFILLAKRWQWNNFFKYLYI